MLLSSLSFAYKCRGSAVVTMLHTARRRRESPVCACPKTCEGVGCWNGRGVVTARGWIIYVLLLLYIPRWCERPRWCYSTMWWVGGSVGWCWVGVFFWGDAFRGQGVREVFVAFDHRAMRVRRAEPSKSHGSLSPRTAKRVRHAAVASHWPRRGHSAEQSTTCERHDSDILLFTPTRRSRPRSVTDHPPMIRWTDHRHHHHRPLIASSLKPEHQLPIPRDKTGRPHRATMNPTDGVPTVLEDAALYRYEMCRNMSSANLPLCVNSTEFIDYNNTDDEILQVKSALKANITANVLAGATCNIAVCFSWIILISNFNRFGIYTRILTRSNKLWLSMPCGGAITPKSYRIVWLYNIMNSILLLFLYATVTYSIGALWSDKLPRICLLFDIIKISIV